MMPPIAVPARLLRRVRRGLWRRFGPLLMVPAAMAPITAAEPVSAQPVADQPASPQPLWPSLQSRLGLPGWVDLDLELTADPLMGKAPTLGIAGAWMQQLVLNTTFSSGLSRDKSQWREFDRWAISLQLSAFSGNANLGQTLGTAFPLQTTAHPVGLWLTEASIERKAAGGEVFLKAGVLPLNPGFVQAPVLNSYIHSALNNTLNLETYGLPINPFAAPGATAHLRLGASSELRLGQFWLQPVIGIASLFGVNPKQPSVAGSLQILQWNLHDLPGTAAVQQPLLRNQRPIARQLPPPLLQIGAYNTTKRNSNQVVYGLLTLAAPLPMGLDHRLWFGLNQGFDPQNNPNPSFLAGGWLAQGLVPGRPLDVLAVGYGSTSFSQVLAPGLRPEGVLELNYTIPISSQLSIQPALQWILQPGGSNRAAVVAAGMQLSLSF
jgi:porin